MSASSEPLPDWEEVLSAAARLQRILPDAVLVGGTAAAIHAEHRLSRDADHVLTDLRHRFEAVLGELEVVAGWQTARARKPVLILGSHGIETGVRQLIREKPLETMTLDHRGEALTIPTRAETLRIKAVLVLRRNATRDYLDFVAMATLIGDTSTGEALRPFDDFYPQPSGESALQQLQAQLASPLPYDLGDTELSEYRHLAPRWHDWQAVKAECMRLADATFNYVCEHGGSKAD
ncbi:MAG: hypothetical protein F4Y86_13180 [Gammaproteobacteria bacterium]|nr:hypothetical protein [Gammaproteobacteria bacterium]MYB38823.1 hypothetical protein [Gammaproteobacteria bacterium]